MTNHSTIDRSSLIPHDPRPLIIHIGPDELVVRQRYETLSIANDVLTALMFVVGSLLFFKESTTYAATWLFTIGSVLFLIRPLIRLTRRVHLRRIHSGTTDATETSMDF